MATTVVFDIGGVLVPEGNRMANLQKTAREVLGDFDSDAFREAYWENRDAYDLGASDGDFWGRVFAHAGVKTFDEQQVASVAARDAELNTTISDEAAALLRDIAEAGVPLAVLSNAPLGMAEKARSRDWAQPFTSMTFSSEHGIKKPERGIYEHVVGDLAASPADLVFFDDREKNVEGARAAGWVAQQWESAAVARQFLVERRVLPQ